MTTKQKLVNALMSDRLVSQKKFPNIQLRTRISDLRKDGLHIECVPVFTKSGKVYIYELDFKKSKKGLKKYGF